MNILRGIETPVAGEHVLATLPALGPYPVSAAGEPPLRKRLNLFPQRSLTHTALIADIKRLMYTTGERSHLLFDTDPASYFLMDIVVSRAVPWTERMARLRGEGAGLLSRPEGIGDDAAGLRSQLQLLAGETDDFRFDPVAKLPHHFAASAQRRHEATRFQTHAHQADQGAIALGFWGVQVANELTDFCVKVHHGCRLTLGVQGLMVRLKAGWKAMLF